MGIFQPSNPQETASQIKDKKRSGHNIWAKEEISPEYSNLSYDSHKEILDKLFIKESNMISINDINQNDKDAIMDI